MFALLLVSIIAIAAVVYLMRACWSMVEALLQGIVGGCGLFWRLARWTVRTAWRFIRWSYRTAIATDDNLSRRTHAAWWSYSYWLKRAYIASQLRARRREKRT